MANDVSSHSPNAFHVVVLSCGPLGIEIANRLDELPEVGRVTLVLAPYRNPRRTLSGKVRHVYRMQGVRGFFDILAAKLNRRRDQGSRGTSTRRTSENIRILRVDDFHSADCIHVLGAERPDLGVVAGTYILQESIFDLPRLGSINLHTGKVPEYRGAAPGFWEMYNGEEEVGVTVHQVERALDSGLVYRQETFPFDPAPPGDPVAFIESYRKDVLHPNGIRMLVAVVADIANGTAVGVAQDISKARTYRSPSHRDVGELRRRVSTRQRIAGPV